LKARKKVSGFEFHVLLLTLPLTLTLSILSVFIGVPTKAVRGQGEGVRRERISAYRQSAAMARTARSGAR
jgi:hypothetical protein